MVSMPNLFQLEDMPNGSYTQDWLVERVMTAGKLWYGRPVPSTTESDFEEPDYTDPEFSEGPTDESSMINGISESTRKMRGMLQSPIRQGRYGIDFGTSMSMWALEHALPGSKKRKRGDEGGDGTVFT